MTILSMQESGRIQVLYNTRAGASRCSTTSGGRTRASASATTRRRKARPARLLIYLLTRGVVVPGCWSCKNGFAHVSAHSSLEVPPARPARSAWLTSAASSWFSSSVWHSPSSSPASSLSDYSLAGCSSCEERGVNLTRLLLAVIVAGVEFVWNNRQQAPAVNRLNKQVPDPRPRSCLSIYFTL